MLKLIGCTVTVISAAMWGREKSKGVIKSAEYTRSVMELVKRTGDEIDTLCCPLEDIFESFNDSFLSETGFLTFLRREGFSSAIETYKKEFPEEIADILKSFGKRLGAGDREEQTALCRRTYMLLSDEYEKICEKLPEKTKMISFMPPLCALCAVILVI